MLNLSLLETWVKALAPLKIQKKKENPCETEKKSLREFL